MDAIFTLENISALIMLSGLEIVLGIDNIIVLTILVGRLPVEMRAKARFLGLALALVCRVVLLFSIKTIMGMQEPWFTIADHTVSAKDLVLFFGGLFLIWKSVSEIYQSVEAKEHKSKVNPKGAFLAVITQIAMVDIVFSLDSVITAVGLVDHIWVMVVAIVFAIIVMMLCANTVGNFIEKHPSLKILALSFLMTIGILLCAEGLHQEFPKGYIYFAMLFSMLVEMLNMRQRKNTSRKSEH